MPDIFDEVEQDLRRARYEALFNKYWPLAATVAAIIVVVVGGWRFYDWRQAQQAAAAGARFEQALRVAGTDAAEADRLLASLASEAPSGYRILARFRQATQLAATDPRAAAQAFDRLAEDQGIGALFQDLARIRAAYLLIDLADPAEVTRRVEPVAAPGRGFRHSARELLAMAALKAGDRQGVERWVKAIQDDRESPQGVRGRAELIATVAGVSGS
jgi:hypothetical protein